MKIKEIDEFKADCMKHRCNRNTMYNEKRCVTEAKQNDCYKKYLKKIERDEEKAIVAKTKQNKKRNESIKKVDERDLELKRILWKRDAGIDYEGISAYANWQEYCVFWNHIFTKEEKIEILKKDLESLWLNQNLDVVHIVSRARDKTLIYDPDNCIIGGRLFHSRLDTYLDLITGKSMNDENREKWLDRIREYISFV